MSSPASTTASCCRSWPSAWPSRSRRPTAGERATWRSSCSVRSEGGVAAGILVGGLGGALLRWATERHRVEGVYRQLATVALAVAAFAGAETAEANGFIAAFIAGLAFGHVARGQCSYLQDFTEDEGELLSVITFTIFGAVLIGPLLSHLTWQIGLYAALSLTVVRTVAVLLALWRTKMMIETRFFVGWFGPRGLASILFALLVVEQLETPGAEVIFDVAMWTVLFSVFAHGVTAWPWVGRLAGRLAAASPSSPEMLDATDMPTRRSLH